MTAPEYIQLKAYARQDGFYLGSDGARAVKDDPDDSPARRQLLVDCCYLLRVCALLMQAANGTQGDMKEFRRCLKELEDMAEYGETPFEGIALDVFLLDYRGARPVHHSVPYREAYRPAYRVVIQKKLKDYLAARRGKQESLQKS